MGLVLEQLTACVSAAGPAEARACLRKATARGPRREVPTAANSVRATAALIPELHLESGLGGFWAAIQQLHGKLVGRHDIPELRQIFRIRYAVNLHAVDVARPIEEEVDFEPNTPK